SRLASVWVKRKIFALATLITRAASWISSLGGRLVSPALIERIRAETAAQEGTFVKEQDDQDQRLVEAYIRDRDRRRQARLRAMRAKHGDEDTNADLRTVTAAPVPAPSPAPVEESTPPLAYDPYAAPNTSSL